MEIEELGNKGKLSYALSPVGDEEYLPYPASYFKEVWDTAEEHGYFSLIECDEKHRLADEAKKEKNRIIKERKEKVKKQKQESKDMQKTLF